MFCGTRFPLAGSPSTCALDAGIVPLPSILLLIFFPIYISIKLRSSSPYSNTQSRFSGALAKWVHWTYVVLVACLLAMRILEVGRIIAADMGVALLPIGLLANAVVMVMLCYGGRNLGLGRARSVEASISLVAYWTFSTIFESIKVARLVPYNQLHPAKGTAYPSSDWLLDNAVILGLLFIFIFVEGVHLALAWRNASGSAAASNPQLKDLEISKPKNASGTFA